jgi:hypothetical protein
MNVYSQKQKQKIPFNSPSVLISQQFQKKITSNVVTSSGSLQRYHAHEEQRELIPLSQTRTLWNEMSRRKQTAEYQSWSNIRQKKETQAAIDSN